MQFISSNSLVLVPLRQDWDHLFQRKRCADCIKLTTGVIFKGKMSR